jgi:hypothetical protein
MNIKTKFILLLGLLCFLHSCTKKEFEGPSIETLYGEFEVIKPLKLTTQNPSFSSNEQVGFHCEFNKPVEWKIVIDGLSTGAYRQITGFSNLIDSNIVIWNGGPSQIPFFSEEDCAIELTFKNEIDTIRDTLIIVSAKTYENGIWVENFEDGIPADGIIYKEDGGEMTFDLENGDALLGNSYFKMGGKVNWEWQLGSLDLPLNITNVSQNSDDLYINIGIFSDLQDLHTGQFINILISEETDTPFNNNTNNNASDLFETPMEVYKMKVPVDWEGWQIKSFRYSDFELKLTEENQDINFDKNPKDISAIRISCLACPSSTSNPICPENFDKVVRTDIDHIIFTSGSSLLDQ